MAPRRETAKDNLCRRLTWTRLSGFLVPLSCQPTLRSGYQPQNATGRMFCYLMLIFLLFMGGHFELSTDGHPNKQNKRPILPNAEVPRLAPQPEWRWKHGLLYFVGDPKKFLRRNNAENQLSYRRSGATMYLEGCLSLFILAVISTFVVLFTVGTLQMEKESYCPLHGDLKWHLSATLYFGFFATAVCWLSTVRGYPSSRWYWIFLYTATLVEFVLNSIGAANIVRAVKSLCSESAPVLFSMEATCIFVWAFITSFAIFSFFMYLKKWNSIRLQKKAAILKEKKWMSPQKKEGRAPKDLGENVNDSLLKVIGDEDNQLHDD